MKEELNKQDKALDALLGQVKTPEAPAWFEARTLARLRREREVVPFFRLAIFRYLGAATCVLLVALTLSYRLNSPEAAPARMSLVVQNQDEQLFAALDAFESYTQQAKEWNQEPY